MCPLTAALHGGIITLDSNAAQTQTHTCCSTHTHIHTRAVKQPQPTDTMENKRGRELSTLISRQGYQPPLDVRPSNTSRYPVLRTPKRRIHSPREASKIACLEVLARTYRVRTFCTPYSVIITHRDDQTPLRPLSIFIGHVLLTPQLRQIDQRVKHVPRTHTRPNHKLREHGTC